MVAFVALTQAVCPRDKVVQLLLDVNPRNPEPWVVGSYYKTRVYRMIAYKHQENALRELDDEALRPGPEGDSGWLSVLARCTNKVEAPGQWDGSLAEYAARFAPIGSWEWVQILAAYRKVQEVVLKNNNKNEGLHGTDASAGISAGN